MAGSGLVSNSDPNLTTKGEQKQTRQKGTLRQTVTGQLSPTSLSQYKQTHKMAPCHCGDTEKDIVSAAYKIEHTKM